MHGRFVGADQHAAAPQIAQLAHRRLRLFGEAHQALAVVLEHLAGVGERTALRRPIEQLFAEVGLEPAHRLAHGRLRAVHLGRGARKAPLVRDRQKRLERCDVHGFLVRDGRIFSSR